MSSEDRYGAEAPGAVPSSQAAPSDGSKKPGPPRTVVDSLERFVDLVYLSKGIRPSLSRAVLKGIARAPALTEAAAAALRRRARADFRGVAALHLATAFATAPERSGPRGAIREVARLALSEHPCVASSPELLALLRTADDDEDPQLTLALLSPKVVSGRLADVQGKAPASEMVLQCRHNLVWCFALWLLGEGKLDSLGVLRLVDDTLALGGKGQARSAEQQWRFASKKPAVQVLRFTRSEFEHALGNVRLELMTARRERSEALARLTQLQQDLGQARSANGLLEQEVRRLRETLADTVRSHDEAMAKARDDFETLKGLVLRRLNEETRLLDEGLAALRRDPPRLNVMDDHAERVLTGLKQAMASIEELPR